MEASTNLTELVRALEDQYSANEISLNMVVHRGEALLEQNKSVLSAEQHQRAMNCVYILEEINAVVLDEGRSMSADERSRVATELQRLAWLVTGV